MQDLINKLIEISYNLSWSWNKDVYSLFREIDEDKWEWSNHNPVKFIHEMNHELLAYIISKKNLSGKIKYIYKSLKEYLSDETYFGKNYFSSSTPIIGYFSAEYGITECLKVYSGGLGVLSGDHLKSSSDLGVPLVGVGLAYSNGYFMQYLNEHGRQSETVEKNNFYNLPMFPVNDHFNNRVVIELDFPGRKVMAATWAINIGRTKIYLLDTNLDMNAENDRYITDTLYGGDSEKRIQQEIVLGVGGTRLLKRLGFDIKAYHINEGHSAFLCLERIKNVMRERGISFTEAKSICYTSNLFTTHTPVPAGFDIFSRDMMSRYFGDYAEKYLKISLDELMAEGHINRNGNDANGGFNMAHLAINNSKFINAVSKLHGEVSRKMWSLPAGKSIAHVTNGIHTLSYLSPYNHELYTLYFGKDWHKDNDVWQRIDEIPDEHIWRVREMNRKNLVAFCREKLKYQLFYDTSENNLNNILNDEVLTIGFARRFATYKRGNLIFRDLDRLRRIVTNSRMPVQFVFSGKAHPKDEEGKSFIAQIAAFTKDEVLKDKIIFLENYSLDIAKHLVQGCDIWLNNPIRPLEASGTSGMKVIANGGLNFSILDGWWDEGYSEENGWKIDSLADESVSAEEKDNYEVNSLYNTLENTIIPMFYSRDNNNVPGEWVKKIKSSVKNLAGYFSTGRMVKEYTEKFYLKVE